MWRELARMTPGMASRVSRQNLTNILATTAASPCARNCYGNFDLLSGLSAGFLDLTINTRPIQLAKNSNHITKHQADNWSNVSIQYFCREVM